MPGHPTIRSSNHAKTYKSTKLDTSTNNYCFDQENLFDIDPKEALLEIFKDIDVPFWIPNDSFQKLSKPLEAVDLAFLKISDPNQITNSSTMYLRHLIRIIFLASIAEKTQLLEDI